MVVRPKEHVGTAYVRAPELWLAALGGPGHDFTYASDAWSAGVLCLMLTVGMRLPWLEVETEQAAASHLRDKFVCDPLSLHTIF